MSETEQVTYEAGEDIDAYCGKCKLVLAHVITAMKGARPAKVECKTCDSVHAYKQRLLGPSSRKRSERSAANEYDKLMDGRDLSGAVKYRFSDAYDEEGLIDHKSFGVGLVVRVLSDKKIRVCFRSGSKTLVHMR